MKGEIIKKTEYLCYPNRLNMEIHNYNLGFISNEDIFTHVANTVRTYRTSINLNDFNSNIIDPIKLTFDSKIYGKSYREIIENECFRQIDKSNANGIGYFHQNLFRYAGRGWVVPRNGETGFDVENQERHIYCEIKNKHNTMNSAAAQTTYIKMQNKILLDDSATCYLVQVISTKSRDEKWKISLRGSRYSHERIRIISIDKFYQIVFGDSVAFMKLCKALPTILDDVIRNGEGVTITNTVFDELRAIRHDLYKSLYLLAFETYEGFDEF